MTDRHLPQALVMMRSLPRAGRGITERAHHLLSSLRETGFDVHLVSLLGPDQKTSDLDELRGLCSWVHLFERMPGEAWRGLRAWGRVSSFIAARDRHPAMTAKVTELLPQVQVVACVDAVFHGSIWPLLSQLPRPERMPAVRSVSPSLQPHRPFYLLDLGEPLSARLVIKSQMFAGVRNWIYRGEAAAVRSLEASAAQVADLTLVASELDLELLGGRAKGGKLWTVGNGVDLTETSTPQQLAQTGNQILFCGDLQNAAHVRAAIWFARSVLPDLRRACEYTTLWLVGKSPLPALKRLAGLPGIQIHDTSTGSMTLPVAMHQCVLGVAPQRSARGASQTVMMMMAMGRPVVSTAAVAINLPAEAAAGPVCAERGPQLVNAIVRLLKDRTLAYNAGQRAREFLSTAATWDVQWRRVRAVLAELAANQHSLIDPDAVATRHSRGVQTPRRRPVTTVDDLK